MDHLARNTVGLWSREAGKADNDWDNRDAASVTSRRRKLTEKVGELRRKFEETRVRMAATHVARDHALAMITVETGNPRSHR